MIEDTAYYAAPNPVRLPVMPFVIENVSLSPGGDNLVLYAADGRSLEIKLVGDCCSSTFFDDDAFLDIKDCLGDELRDIYEDGALPDRVKYDSTDVEQWSTLRIVTNRNDFRIPFRNDSNGYYGGWAEWDREWNKYDGK
jgi:hypothetical protein